MLDEWIVERVLALTLTAWVWPDIWPLEAHHSTALEGDTLALRQVEALLDKGKAVGAKLLKEYTEVQGYGGGILVVSRGHGTRCAPRCTKLDEVAFRASRGLTPLLMAPPTPGGQEIS